MIIIMNDTGSYLNSIVIVVTLQQIHAVDSFFMKINFLRMKISSFPLKTCDVVLELGIGQFQHRFSKMHVRIKSCYLVLGSILLQFSNDQKWCAAYIRWPVRKMPLLQPAFQLFGLAILNFNGRFSFLKCSAYFWWSTIHSFFEYGARPP